MTDFQLEQRVMELAQKGYQSWGHIAELERCAQSDRTRRYIHNTAVSLYHREEAVCGLL